MKLMWITPECPYPPNHGGRIGVWKRIEYLAENNDIYLYSINDDENNILIQTEIEKYCKKAKFYPRNSKIKSVLKAFKYPYPAVSRWNTSLRKDLKIDYEELVPDYILVDFPQMIGVLPQNCMESNKVVLNQHNIECLSMHSLAKSMHNPIKRIMYNFVAIQLRNYEDLICKENRFKIITFVSSSDKKWYEKRYGVENTLLVPVGTEIASQKEMIVNCHNMIFVANMSYPANEEAALWLINNVWPEVVNAIPDAKLYLVGKNPREYLIEEASKYNSVIVTGTVDSVEEYYKFTNLVSVPIMSGGGVNIKLLEALGKGKIVITTSKGIDGTDLIGGVHVLVSDSAREFICECIHVLKKPFDYEKMRIEALEFVEEKYSWKGIVRQLEQKMLEMR